MRTLLAVILATILGVALGAGVAMLRIAVAPWDGDPGGIRRGTSKPALGGRPAPIVVVDQERYEFGTLDLTGEGSHDFLFSNRGNATLQLSSGGTSCGCTLSKIADPTIEPGESGTVTLTWTAERGSGPYRQTATIKTNDPMRPLVQLVVSGEIARTIRTVPARFLFGQVAVVQPETREVRLLGYLDRPLVVLSCEVTERTTADFFDVAFEPLSADQLQEPESPGGEPNVGEPQGPQNGYLLRVTLKPGLPLGAFRQTILIRTDQESVATIEIPVAGTVVGDISIAGPGWNDQNALLSLGTLSSREETVWRLLLVVRGPYSKEVQFTLIRTVPDLIEVDQQALTQTTPIGDGTVTQTPLVIRIPEGSRPVNCLGSKLGEILIGTSHPDIPELPIRVRFAVEGG